MLDRRAVFVFLALGVSAAITAAEKPKRSESPPGRITVSDDALPLGAIARLGTTHLRPGDLTGPFALSPDGKIILTGEDGWLRLWQVESGKELRAIHLPRVTWFSDLSFAPDGSQVMAVGTNSGQVDSQEKRQAFLLEARTGKVLRRVGDGRVTRALFLGHGKFAMIREGATLSGGNTGPKPPHTLWDLMTGKKLHSLENVRFLDSASDGTRLVTVEDGTIIVRDVPLWLQIQRLKVPHEWISSLAISPDGRLVAAGSQSDNEHTLRVWDAASGKQLHHLRGFPEMVTTLRFSPDSSTLLSGVGHPPPKDPEFGTRDVTPTSVLVWDVVSGTVRCCLPGIHEPENCAFAPDGQSLYHGQDGTLQQTQLATGEVRRWNLPRGAGSTLAVSADGKRLVFGDEGLVVWDREKARELHPDDHRLPIEALFFSPDGKCLVTLEQFGSLRLWDVRTGRLLPEFKLDHSLKVSGCAFNTKDNSLAAISDVVRHCRWDLSTGRLLCDTDLTTAAPWGTDASVAPEPFRIDHSFRPIPWRYFECWGRHEISFLDPITGKRLTHLPFSSADSRPVSVSPDGKAILSLTRSDLEKKPLSLWDLESGKRLAQMEGQKDQALHYHWSPDNSLLAWGCGDRIHFRDRKQNKEIGSLVLADENYFYFDQDSRSVIGFRRGRPPLLWDAASGRTIECLTALEQYPYNWGVPRSSEGRVLVQLSRTELRKTIYEVVTGRPIGEVATGRPIINNRSGDPEWILSPDARLMAVGDGNGHIVETATGGVAGRLPSGHRGQILALAFSPDGRRLATGGSDSTAMLWDVDAVCGIAPVASKKEPDELWHMLGSSDAAVAHRAIAELRGNPEQALRMLGKRLRPVSEETVAPLRRGLRDLDSSRFSERDRAMKELKTTSAEWEFVFREAQMAQPSLEMRRRLDEVRKSPALLKFSPEGLQAIRGVQVLERIGTAEARRLLKQLAEGLPAAHLTDEAKAALKRLEVPAQK